MDHHPTNPGNKSITLLRVILWLLPAFLLLACMRLWISLNPNFFLALALVAALIVPIGYIDRRLYLHRERLNASLHRVETIRWAIGFTLLQIIIAPGFASRFFILTSQTLPRLGI